jgi:hypothetical protein
MKDIIIIELNIEAIEHYTHQEAEAKLHIIQYFLECEHREEVIEKYYKYILFLNVRLKNPEHLKYLLDAYHLNKSVSIPE